MHGEHWGCIGILGAMPRQRKRPAKAGDDSRQKEAADEAAQRLLGKKDYQRACGARLRAMIKGSGISFAAAARDMGIEPNHLGNMMRGAIIPTFNLYRLCRRRSLSFDWVYLGDPANLRDPVKESVLSWEEAPDAASAPVRKASARA